MKLIGTHITIGALALAALLTLGSCGGGSGNNGSETSAKQETKTEQSTTNNTTNAAPQAAARKENKTMKPVQMTAEMFRERVMDYVANPNEWKFKGEKPALIDFYATWCGPCKMMSPIVDEMAEKYGDQIDVYKVDVDQEEELAGLFGIRSIPTILFIPMEGQPQSAVGAMGKADFEQAVKQVLLGQ